MTPVDQRSSAAPLLAAQLASYLLPGHHPDEFLLWPPDLFALTSLALEASESYTRLLSPSTSQSRWPPVGWAREIEAVAAAWRARLDTSPFLTEIGMAERQRWSAKDRARRIVAPRKVRRAWRIFRRRWTDPRLPVPEQEPISEIAGDWELLLAVIELNAIADSTCSSIGASSDRSQFAVIARRHLQRTGSLASFDTRRGRVLPKTHTSQVGITPRSLSLYVAFDQSPVRVNWMQSHDAPRHEDASAKQFVDILLFPWPFHVRCSDFVPHDGPCHPTTPHHKFFAYSPAAGEDASALEALRKVLDAAHRQLPTQKVRDPKGVLVEGKAPLDLLVMPEAALQELSLGFYDVLEQNNVGSFVIGMREGFGKGELAGNALELGYASTLLRDEASNSKERFVTKRQHKHHRWRVDKAQIAAYSIGRSLDPGAVWWEGIRLESRSVSFMQLPGELLVAGLICEDLARQDPVGRLIRSVGPSLVVTVLMDGPQFASRWSANYATVLADDPGSSVLTLTSRGMVDRWNTPHAQWRRVVALWKDPKSGPPRELDIGDAAAFLLRAELLSDSEYSADTRVAAGRPFLVLREALPLRVDGL